MRIPFCFLLILRVIICNAQITPEYIPITDTAYLNSLQKLILPANQRIINRSNHNDNRIILFKWVPEYTVRHVGPEMMDNSDQIAQSIVSTLRWSNTITELVIVYHAQHFLGSVSVAFNYKLSGHNLSNSEIKFTSEEIGGTLSDALEEKIKGINIDSNRTLFTHVGKNKDITLTLYSYYNERKYNYWELACNNDMIPCAQIIDSIFSTIPKCSEVKVFYFGQYGTCPGGAVTFKRMNWKKCEYKNLLELSRQNKITTLDKKYPAKSHFGLF